MASASSAAPAPSLETTRRIAPPPVADSLASHPPSEQESDELRVERGTRPAYHLCEVISA